VNAVFFKELQEGNFRYEKMKNEKWKMK
jgi:hypothetical protein